jgi:hypothetical protein
MQRLYGLTDKETITEVHTWEAVSTKLDLNYIEDNSFGATSRAFNQRAIKMKDLMQKKKPEKDLPLMNPLKSLSKEKTNTDVDLGSMDLEFEFRTSKLIDLVCTGYLASMICNVTFHEDNILDL